jgi:hypothetical protein
MKLYRTGLWCDDEQHPIAQGRGRGWHLRPRGRSFTGTDEEFEQFQAQRRTRLGMMTTVINPPPPGPGRKTFTVSDEVLILVPNRGPRRGL